MHGLGPIQVENSLFPCWAHAAVSPGAPRLDQQSVSVECRSSLSQSAEGQDSKGQAAARVGDTQASLELFCLGVSEELVAPLPQGFWENDLETGGLGEIEKWQSRFCGKPKSLCWWEDLLLYHTGDMRRQGPRAKMSLGLVLWWGQV